MDAAKAKMLKMEAGLDACWAELSEWYNDTLNEIGIDEVLKLVKDMESMSLNTKISPKLKMMAELSYVAFGELATRHNRRVEEDK